MGIKNLLRAGLLGLVAIGLPGAVIVENARIPSGIYELKKFHTEDDQLADLPFEVQSWPNAYVNSGSQVWLDLLTGAGGTVYSNANAYIGVGDSTTAVVATQTDLQATTNKFRKGMDATFPSRSGQVTTWRASFGSGEANFAWQEAGLFNASTGGQMLSRIVSNLGTKSGGVWQLSYTITLPA